MTFPLRCPVIVEKFGIVWEKSETKISGPIILKISQPLLFCNNQPRSWLYVLTYFLYVFIICITWKSLEQCLGVCGARPEVKSEDICWNSLDPIKQDFLRPPCTCLLLLKWEGLIFLSCFIYGIPPAINSALHNNGLSLKWLHICMYKPWSSSLYKQKYPSII